LAPVLNHVTATHGESLQVHHLLAPLLSDGSGWRHELCEWGEVLLPYEPCWLLVNAVASHGELYRAWAKVVQGVQSVVETIVCLQPSVAGMMQLFSSYVNGLYTLNRISDWLVGSLGSTRRH
jgi:hypothetical protein